MRISDEEKVKIMQASIAGKKIQYRTYNAHKEEWKYCGITPVWDWYDHEYRVAPEPLIEGWVNVYDDGTMSRVHRNEDSALSALMVSGRTVKMREVRE